MNIRVTYRMERFIECDNLQAGKKEFESCDLNDGNSEYIEVVSVEDADTFENLTEKF